MDWFTQDQVVLRTVEYKRYDRTELKNEARISLVTGARSSEAESLKKSQLAKYKITYTNTKGRKNLTAPISKELYKSLPDDKNVDCLVIFMARSGLLWKEQASNYWQNNLPTFYATPSPATL
jgi:integrase